MLPPSPRREARDQRDAAERHEQEEDPVERGHQLVAGEARIRRGRGRPECFAAADPSATA